MPNKSTPNARNSAAVSDSVPLLTVHKLLGKCLQRARYPCAVAIAVITISTVIAQQPAITPQQHNFFRHVLRTIGSPDYNPSYIADFERAFAQRFALSSNDAAVIHAAAQSFRTAVLNTRQAEHAITHNNSRLTPADGAAINALLTTQEQTIDSLSTQILQGISPASAARLLAAANVPIPIVKGK
jgi:hypothetical protein